MSGSTSHSEDAVSVKVEKSSEGELVKTVSTATSSNAESSSRKESDKPSFRGPEGEKSRFSVKELKKLKIHIEIAKPKASAATLSGAIDPSSITPVRRPDQSSTTEELIDHDSKGPSNEPQNSLAELAGDKKKLIFDSLKIPFSSKRKPLSENEQFERACKRRRKDDTAEYDAVGFAMSRKLLRMVGDQAIYAERLMHEILEKGLLNELSSHTKITDSSHRAPK